MTEDLVRSENQQRLDAYRKDGDLEQAVLSLNRALAPHEPGIDENLAPLPNLFVFGLPRAGTTLTHQVLTWALDVGYVSNVMARFWLAPHAGAILSNAILGDRRDGTFASDYGKSLEPAGGHEFAYFWQHWLGINRVERLLDFSGDSEVADWEGAAAAVCRIQMAVAKPLVFKTNYAGQFLPAFARTFPMPLFIHVRRRPLDVALSILQARRRYYGDTSKWWATYPPNYESLAPLPPVEQIAGQVAGLRRAYAAQIAKAPAELTVELDYEALCADPQATVDTVRERCRDVHGATPDLLHPLPARFDLSPPRSPASDEEHALAEALERALAETA